jgi:hypothetical protein
MKCRTTKNPLLVFAFLAKTTSAKAVDLCENFQVLKGGLVGNSDDRTECKDEMQNCTICK